MKTEELISRLAREARPVVPASPVRMVLLWALLSVGLVVGIVAATCGFRSDLARLAHVPSFLLTSVPLLAALVSAGYLALSLSIPGRVVRPWQVWTPPALFLLFAALLCFYRGPASPGVMTSGFPCALTLFALSVLPGLILFVMLKRLAVMQPITVALALGLAAGAVGLVGLGLHCAKQEAVHLWIFHALPVVLLALAARALLGRMLRW